MEDVEFDQDSTLHGEELGDDAPGPLPETTPEERKKEVRLRKAERRKAAAKSAAAYTSNAAKATGKAAAKGSGKTLLGLWDNAEILLGPGDRALLVWALEMLRQGDRQTAFLIACLAAVAWILKVRKGEPGAIVRFFQKKPAEYRQLFVKAGEFTFRRG